MHVQGAEVAVVDAGLLLVEAGGENLGLGQAHGYGVALDADVIRADLGEVDPRLDLPRGYEEYLFAGEEALQNIAAALPGYGHRLGPAHGGELVQLPYALHDHGSRRRSRRPLLQEPSEDGHGLHEVEAADPDAERDAHQHDNQRQHERRA